MGFFQTSPYTLPLRLCVHVEGLPQSAIPNQLAGVEVGNKTLQQRICIDAGFTGMCNTLFRVHAAP